MKDKNMDEQFSQIDETTFLVGPDRDETDIDVDKIFGKTLEQSFKDHEGNPQAFMVIHDTDAVISIADPKFAFADVECGLALIELSTGYIQGGIFGCDLVLARELHGRGIGKEIVGEYFIRNGDLPTWHLDTPAYSPVGLATCRSAWKWLKVSPEPWDREQRMVKLDNIQITIPYHTKNSFMSP